MKLHRVVLIFVLFLISGSASWAVNLSGQSRTYLQSRETVDSMQLLPLFEYLDLDADSLGIKNMAFHFGGWYRFDLQDESFGDKKHDGDLQYAYLGFRGTQNNSFLNLGRILVNQGIASEQVDGAAAGTDLRGGIALSAFGGIPVETTIDTRSGDSVYGGRISQGKDDLYRIGVSYLLEKNDKQEFRKEEGVDLWFRPFTQAEILGTLLYNAATSETAETSAYLTLGPFKNLTLRTQYRDISYKDYFTASSMTAFQFTPGGLLDPNEKMKTLGEEASLTLGKAVVSADYKKHDYDIAGSADYYGGRISYSGSGSGTGLTYHRMKGEADDLCYSEYRAYAYGRIGKLTLTADGLMVAYDTEINGVKNAYTAVLAGGYPLSPRTMLGADVEYGKNPYYDKDVRGFLKLVHNFDVAPAPAQTKTKRRK